VKRLILLAAFASVSALWLFGGAATASSGTVIYDSTVSPLPGNMPSLGFEATSTSEFGDSITFAGTARTLQSVTVTMSSWGCESGGWNNGDCVTTPGTTFSVPITLNIYAANNPTPTGLITSVTKTFNIPYRPSADNVHCTGDEDAGKWYQGSSKTCFNGLAANITFDFSASNLTLPDNIVYGIAYNTTHYGSSPVGEAASCYTSSGGCGYDSLNVALAPSVAVGSKPFPDTAYLNSTWAGAYCDLGADGTGTFRLDSVDAPCWAGYVPAVRFVAVNQADQCKGGGWATMTTAGGASFKNQGDCVSYFSSKGKAKGNP